MDSRTESSLLRLAIAKGLLRWEDLDAVADRIPDRGADPDVTLGEGPWVQALVEAGLLDPAAVAALTSQVEQAESGLLDSTPDLSWGQRPTWPRSETDPGQGLAASALTPEFRFLATWRRYRVKRFLGAGGMGSVYKAFDPSLNRHVALKFLHRNDPVTTERFLREAQSQARVDHPNVCQVHEVGEVDGRPYIAMQYIEGRSLGELSDELPLRTKAALMRDVARAVHAAHKTGLVHRDLKPGNILLARRESGDIHPYVVDFGLAQELEQDGRSLTRTGMISGTPAYVSPEQAQGQPLDPRTDVYSLGVVLYELLGGAPPFADSNLARILVRIIQEDVRPLRAIDPSIPEDLETIAAKCLEKDPALRYDSAWAFAEDLERFLEGEPIQARPAGWLYRAGKRLRKHRTLAIVSAAALLALAVLGGASLRAQWQARERAELAQRFGQRVAGLEAEMRYAAFLPLHDMTTHKRKLRRELDGIEGEMRRLGPLAEGPGHSALGQGYLALHRYELAREHLERAWQAGERGPGVAATLGRTFGYFYEKSLADANRFQSTETANRATREEIERAFRRPALAYLRESAGEAAPQSPFLAALIAFYEGRYEEALALARRTSEQTPWFYEAAQLEAEIHAAQGDDAATAGLYDEALRFYGAAGDVYRRTVARVPSDASLYAGDCGRWVRQIEAALLVGKLEPRDLGTALETCDRALKADPELGEALVLKSRIYWRHGESRMRRGEDPSGDLSSSVALAQRAIGLNPQDAGAYNNLAIASHLLAQWGMARGADPAAAIARGIDAAQMAVKLRPELASAHSTLGNAYLVRVTDQQRKGADPRQALAAAAASYGRAVERNPRFLPALVNLGTAWKTMAEIEIAQGQDPTASLTKAVEASGRAERLNPNSAVIYNALGNIHLTLGDYQLARGTDPRQALARAAATYERALALNADYALAHYNLGFTKRSLAQARLDRGEDPGSALAEADHSLEEALRLNPTDADVFLERARGDLIAARWARRQGGDAEQALREASAELRRAEALNPEQPDVYLAQAEIERWRAEWAPTRKAGHLEAGLERVRKALAINPGEARYLAYQGLLLHRLAQREQAAASLEEALKINPLLRREYGPILEEARKGTQGTARTARTQKSP
jgi:serine/threonine-protein kinase